MTEDVNYRWLCQRAASVSGPMAHRTVAEVDDHFLAGDSPLRMMWKMKTVDVPQLTEVQVSADQLQQQLPLPILLRWSLVQRRFAVWCPTVHRSPRRPRPTHGCPSRVASNPTVYRNPRRRARHADAAEDPTACRIHPLEPVCLPMIGNGVGIPPPG